MKKYFFTLTLLAFCGSVLFAQSFGVRAGINNTTLSVSDDGVSVDFGGKINPALGVFFDLPVGEGKIIISPELTYFQRGFDIDFFENIETKLNYLDLGVIAKYMVVDNEKVDFYLGAGPVLGYALGGTVEGGGVKEDIEFDDDDGFNRTYLNLAGVAGVNIGENLFVEARYMLGLSSLNADDDSGSTKWSSIGLNVGYRF
jgi:hypothetical protein